MGSDTDNACAARHAQVIQRDLTLPKLVYKDIMTMLTKEIVHPDELTEPSVASIRRDTIKEAPREEIIRDKKVRTKFYPLSVRIKKSPSKKISTSLARISGPGGTRDLSRPMRIDFR